MITLTKLNGVTFLLNCELIETVFETPDTTIHLTNGNIYIVKETMNDVLLRSISYKRQIYSNLLGKEGFHGKEK